MEFNNQNGAHGQNGTAKEIFNKAAQNGAAKTNGTSAKKEHANAKAEAEKQKPSPVKDVKPEPVQQEVPKQEVQKTDEAQQSNVEAQQSAKPVQTLEATLKTVDMLHRRSVQRLNLISRLKQIEAFEVALAQESDELEDNPYQGCKLIIEDDKQRRFITSTPGLIRLVSQFIFSACNEKLAEIEAAIVFPNA
jgi:hypothetical protein